MTEHESHFHMSDNYSKHSSSQLDIGQLVIEKAVSLVRRYNFAQRTNLKVLDVACGPGNLTQNLLDSLATELPTARFEVIGLDYSRANVGKLIERSRGNIQGLVGSFFDESLMPGGEDVIFSNEGLHWQPPYEMSEIIYSHLDEEQRTEYERWALTNLEKALCNIYNSLSEGGLAILQFGRKGQLDALWDLVKEVLEQDQFTEYKELINFPLFYPNLQQVETVLQNAGFKSDRLEIDAFNQDLVERTPSEITAFFRAFSEPAFRRVMDEQTLEAFYGLIEQKLDSVDLDVFRKEMWKRTLITARK